MKKPTRVIGILMVVISLFSVLCIGVSAASTKTTSSKSWTGKSTGYCSTDIFVKTGSSAASRKVNISSTYGSLGGDLQAALVYGSYEFTIYKWNASTKKWVQEQNYDFYNKSSGTITLKQKNTIYKIHVYAWKSQTVYNSYWNKNVKCWDGFTKFRPKFSSQIKNGAHWRSVPTLEFTPGNNCTMYNSCPV